jgi:multicomponent Na+:H+ antiporter subunit C
MVDPLPQALMLTAIVVGVCVMALALVLVYRLYARFRTLDVREIEQRLWKGDD